MKVTNSAYPHIILNGLKKTPITLKAGESITFPNSELIPGYERLFSTFDPVKISFDKSIEFEIDKPAKEKKVESPKVVESVKESVTTPTVEEPVEKTEKIVEEVKDQPKPKSRKSKSE